MMEENYLMKKNNKMITEAKKTGLINPEDIDKNSKKKDVKKIKVNKNDIVERDNNKVITDDGRELLK